MGLNYHAEAASKPVRHNEMAALDFGGARRRNLPRVKSYRGMGGRTTRRVQ